MSRRGGAQAEANVRRSQTWCLRCRRGHDEHEQQRETTIGQTDVMRLHIMEDDRGSLLTEIELFR